MGKSTNFVSNPSAVQTVVTGGTIIVYSALIKLKSADDATGLKLGKGTYDGQHLWLMNEGTTQVNFDTDEATSRIKGGGSLALSSGRFYHFMWNATDSLWYL